MVKKRKQAKQSKRTKRRAPKKPSIVKRKNIDSIGENLGYQRFKLDVLRKEAERIPDSKQRTKRLQKIERVEEYLTTRARRGLSKEERERVAAKARSTLQEWLRYQYGSDYKWEGELFEWKRIAEERGFYKKKIVDEKALLEHIAYMPFIMIGKKHISTGDKKEMAEKRMKAINIMMEVQEEKNKGMSRKELVEKFIKGGIVKYTKKGRANGYHIIEQLIDIGAIDAIGSHFIMISDHFTKPKKTKSKNKKE